MAKNQNPPQGQGWTAEERGLSANLDAERFVLGGVMVDASQLPSVKVLRPDDFAVEKHRRIFRAILSAEKAGKSPDRVTIADELNKRGQLESVDGISYIVSLDEGLPTTFDLSSYVRVVREHSVRRRLTAAGHEMFEAALGKDGVDVDEIIARAKSRLTGFEEDLIKDEDFAHTPADIIKNFPGGVNEFFSPPKSKTGLQTGFKQFDKMTGGLEPGCLYILSGDTSAGKSAFALQLATQAAMFDEAEPSPIHFFSLEMRKAALLRRMVASRASVSTSQMRRGYLDPESVSAVSRALGASCDVPIYIDDSRGIGANEMWRRARKLRKEKKTKLVIVDYMQKFDMRADGFQREYDALTHASNVGQSMAFDLECPVLFISQFSRPKESKNRSRSGGPQLSDLHGTSAIEKDADGVFFLVADEENGNKYEVPVSLHVKKMRDNERNYALPFMFERVFVRYREIQD